MKGFLFKYFLILVFLSFTSSCKDDEKKPDNIWEMDRFTEVLTEVQLGEAAVRLEYHKRKDSLVPNDSVYAAAFRKMNTNRAEFDSNYDYYLNHPKEMEKVYEQIITNLSERSAALNEKNSSQN